MSEDGLGMVQKCSTENGHLSFLYMADKRFDLDAQGRRKQLIGVLLDRGAEVRQVIPDTNGERRRIYLVAPANYQFGAYFERLKQIFQDGTCQNKIHLCSAFKNSSGTYTNCKPQEVINAWFDLEYGIFITFKEKFSQSIIDYLRSIQAPTEQIEK